MRLTSRELANDSEHKHDQTPLLIRFSEVETCTSELDPFLFFTPQQGRRLGWSTCNDLAARSAAGRIVEGDEGAIAGHLHFMLEHEPNGE